MIHNPTVINAIMKIQASYNRGKPFGYFLKMKQTNS